MRCFYCDTPISPGEFQRDHFPVPKRHGGMATVIACKNCHSLKDRIPFDRWPSVEAVVESFAGLERTDWAAMPPLTRLAVAKMISMILDGPILRCEHGEDCLQCYLDRERITT